MDLLPLEALRFGVAVLAGGIVALISSWFWLRHSQRLQREDSERRDSAVRRALVMEIRENMRRMGGPEPTSSPSVPVLIDAWRSARPLLTVDEFDSVSAAYIVGETLNRTNEFVHLRALQRAGEECEDRIHEVAAEHMRRDAAMVFKAFVAALEELGEPLIQAGKPLVVDRRGRAADRDSTE